MLAMNWILILFAHVGTMGNGNSNSLAIAEFRTQALCEYAGNSAREMAGGTTKIIKFICVKKYP